MNRERFDQMAQALARGTSRRQALTLLGGGLLGGTALATGLASTTAKGKHKHKGHKRAGKRTNPLTNIPVNGHGPGGAQFKGLLDVTSFAVQNNQLVALGSLTGQVTHGGQGAQDVPATDVTLPVAIPGVDLASARRASAQQVGTAATCQILNLTLGPLDLNVLGLLIHLDQVHVTITAQSGAGNLLGNLLCSIANLLNGGLSGILGQLADLLNQLLAALNGV